MAPLRISLACLAMVAACDVTPPAPPRPLTPSVVGDHLAIADVDAASLAILDPAAGHAGALRRLPLSGPPSLVVPVPGRGAALVLSRTERTVDLMDLTEGASPARRSFDVGAPFEQLTVSDDARFAVAWFPPNTASAVFHNENEVALIDLSAELEPAAAVSRRTLPSLGGAPRLVAFSPPVGNRRYLFALSDEHVAIAAADAPERRERSVPLVSLTTGGARTPTAITFGTQMDSGGVTTLWAIVTTAEGNAVYALAITPRADPEAGEADFDVNLSQLAGIGPGGAAMLLALPPREEGGRERLATLTTHPGAGTITLTDVLTATGRSLPLSQGLNRIVRFRGERGVDEALVYARGARSSTFHVVDILAFDTGEQRATRTRTTRESFSDVVPIPGSARFVILRDNPEAAVGILDADTDRVAGFGRTGMIRSLQLDTDLDRLYALTYVDGADWLVSVDLADLHPEASRVPVGGEALYLLPGADTIATWSSRSAGTLVLWPALSTLPEDAFAMPAFLLGGLAR